MSRTTNDRNTRRDNSAPCDARHQSREEASGQRETDDTPKPWIVMIAASAGGIQALRAILPVLPRDLPAAVVLVLHRPMERKGFLHDILRQSSPLPVHDVAQGELVRPGTVYLARADSHLTVTADRQFIYRNGSVIKFLRASVNPLMESAAKVYGGHAVAVVLTGTGTDGTDGVQFVKAHGGVVIAQDEATSEHWPMPKAAIATGAVDYILPVGAIGAAINEIVRGRPIPTAAVTPCPVSLTENPA